MIITAVVDTQTRRFVPEGHAPDDRYVVVELPRNPDPAWEAYTGNPKDPFDPIIKLNDPPAPTLLDRILALEAAVTHLRALVEEPIGVRPS